MDYNPSVVYSHGRAKFADRYADNGRKLSFNAGSNGDSDSSPIINQNWLAQSRGIATCPIAHTVAGPVLDYVGNEPAADRGFTSRIGSTEQFYGAGNFDGAFSVVIRIWFSAAWTASSYFLYHGTTVDGWRIRRYDNGTTDYMLFAGYNGSVGGNFYSQYNISQTEEWETYVFCTDVAKSEYTIYRNGVDVSNAANSMLQPGTVAGVGVRTFTNTEATKVSKVQTYDRVLTQAEVALVTADLM